MDIVYYIGDVVTVLNILALLDQITLSMLHNTKCIMDRILHPKT